MSEVLIIGAGPTGLTLACELIKRGVDVRIIDQAPQSSIYSKALALQPRTLEVFEKMGIVDEFFKKGLPITQINYHYGQKTASLNLNFPEDVPYPFILCHPQSETENILNQTLEGHGKKVERTVTLKRIVPNEFAILQHPDDNEEIVYPKWIIGCDGAHSTVRQVLSIPFEGTEITEAFVLADVQLMTTLPHNQFSIFLSDKGLCGLIPLPEENTYRIILPFRKNIQLDRSMLDVNFLQRIISERLTGNTVKIKSMIWTSLFFIHRNIAPHFRYHNVFLAGDAAHVHSPAGGQGLNTSVQDAQNLAWKLALVMQGHGKKTLLDSYEKERLPIAKKVLKMTTKVTKKVQFFQRHPSNFLFNLLGWKVRRRRTLRRFSLALGELNINYENSPIVKFSFKDLFWKGPLPGTRAPDVKFSENKRLFQHFEDPRHIILFFSNDLNKTFIEKMRQQFDRLIKIIVVSSEQSGPDLIYDPENKIKKMYNAQTDTIYFIRPDGYIGYRRQEVDESDFLKYLERFLKI